MNHICLIPGSILNYYAVCYSSFVREQFRETKLSQLSAAEYELMRELNYIQILQNIYIYIYKLSMGSFRKSVNLWYGSESCEFKRVSAQLLLSLHHQDITYF